MASERIRSIDVAKGVIITAIVFAHLFMTQVKTGTSSGVPTSPIVLAGYLCLMMFFIISGYFYRPERSSRDNIIKRLKILGIAIVICTVTLPLILMGYLALLGQHVDINWYFSNLITLFGHKEMFMPYDGGAEEYWVIWVTCGYYFLQTMLIAFIIFYASAKVVMSDWKKTIVAIFLLVTATVLIRQFCYRPPLYLDIAPIACAFMFVGTAAKQYGFVERFDNFAWLKNYRWAYVIVAIVAAGILLTTLVPMMQFQDTYFGDYDGWSAYPFFIEALLCCFVGFIVMTLIAKIPYFSDLMILIGKHSLAILLFHMLIIKIIIAPFYPLSTLATLPAMPAAVAIVTGIITIAVIVFLATVGMDFIKKRMHKDSA